MSRHVRVRADGDDLASKLAVAPDDVRMGIREAESGTEACRIALYSLTVLNYVPEHLIDKIRILRPCLLLVRRGTGAEHEIYMPSGIVS